MHDNLEMKEGGRGIELRREPEGQTLKSKEKVWGKGKNAVFEVTKHLKYNFENHKASTRTRVLPVQESKNKKRRPQTNKNN